jgi:DNA-binding XRE family transcriptional regulator
MYAYQMSTSSTRTKDPQTEMRKVRTFLDDLMAGVRTPPICRRIRELREERFELDKQAAREERRANRFSQEAMAQRVGVSLKAYRAYEDTREPDYERRQAIAAALDLPDDFFENQVSQSQELQDLRGELAEVRGLVEELLRRSA